MEAAPTTSSPWQRASTIRGPWRRITFWFCLVFGVFSVFTSGLGLIPSLNLRALHLMMGMSIVTLALDIKGDKRKEDGIQVWDLLIVLANVVCGAYIILTYSRIYRLPGIFQAPDYVLGAIMILLSIECARRVYGWVIPGLLGAALLYLAIAPYLPGVWGIPWRPYTDYVAELYATPNGVYGIMTDMSATILAGFMIFGGLLLYTGAGEYFIRLANILTGRFSGGPAKVAVVASMLFGTLSGSAVANVAMTGNYTIPLMKKTGYRPEFAGAVESVASSGGMLTPPIMGAAAFIMAELLGISYLQIILYAIIPCLLYYGSVFAGVHFEAKRTGLAGLKKEDVPSPRTLLALDQILPFAIPIIALLTFLATGWSITFAMFAAIIVLVATFVVFSIPSRGIKKTIVALGNAGSDAAISLARLAPLSACMSMVIYTFGLSGITLKISDLIMQVGQNHVLLALIPAGIVPLLLGMSVPPVAAYVVGASIVAPALVQLGVSPLVANFFVFYVSCLAPFTPPVCAACYVAGTIAGASWMKIAGIAVKLGFIAYLVSFFIVINPAFLGQGPISEVALAFIFGMLGTVVIVSGFIGFWTAKLPLPLRFVLVAAGITMIWPEWTSSLVGAAVAGIVLVYSTVVSRRVRERVSPAV